MTGKRETTGWGGGSPYNHSTRVYSAAVIIIPGRDAVTTGGHLMRQEVEAQL